MSLRDWFKRKPRPKQESISAALARMAAINGAYTSEPAASAYRDAPEGCDEYSHWTTHLSDADQSREDWRVFHESAAKGRRARPWLSPSLKDTIDGEWRDE